MVDPKRRIYFMQVLSSLSREGGKLAIARDTEPAGGAWWQGLVARVRIFPYWTSVSAFDTKPT